MLSGGLKISTTDITQGRKQFLDWQKEIGSPGAISSLTAYIALQKKLAHVINENAEATRKATLADADNLAVLKVREPMLEAVLRSGMQFNATREEAAALEAKRRELWRSTDIRAMLDQADSLQGQHRYADAARLRTQANLDVQTQLGAFGTLQQAERAASYVQTVRKRIDELTDGMRQATDTASTMWNKLLHPYTDKQLQDAVKTWTAADAKADRLLSDAVSKYNQKQTADKVKALAEADAGSFGATDAAFAGFGHYTQQMQDLQAQLDIRMLPRGQRDGAARWGQLQQDNQLTDSQRRDLYDAQERMKELDEIDARMQQKAATVRSIFDSTFSSLNGGLKGMLNTLEDSVIQTLQHIASEVATDYALRKLFGLSSDGAGGYEGGNGTWSKVGAILGGVVSGGGYSPDSTGNPGYTPSFVPAYDGGLGTGSVFGNSVAHHYHGPISVNVNGAGQSADAIAEKVIAKMGVGATQSSQHTAQRRAKLYVQQ